MIIKYPMDKEKLKELKAGDVVEFEGVIYTARDAAHMRMKKMLENKEALPVDFNDAFIYYAGPTPMSLLLSVRDQEIRNVQNFIKRIISYILLPLVDVVHYYLRPLKRLRKLPF